MLYHCCVSLAEAQAIERAGFDPDQLIAVTDTVPDKLGRDPSESHAVVCLGVPFEFKLDEYPSSNTGERLVPGIVLNAFPRAIWPE